MVTGGKTKTILNWEKMYGNVSLRYGLSMYVEVGNVW